MYNTKLMQNKKILIGASVLVFVFLVAGFLFLRDTGGQEAGQPEPTPVPEPVNVIPVSERPYVTLQPMTSRNDLAFVIYDLKTPAESVEVTLEYDRNEGVMDALFRSLELTEVPLEETLFMGSKSAGGHITYHDDVIGGTLLLEFEGDEPYALETPWRYDDKETSYTQLSTADGYFQVELAQAYRTPKVVIMQSPGVPENPDGEIIGGPYLFRGVGELPEGDAEIAIRLSEAVEQAQMLGWDGSQWQVIESVLEGRTVSAETQIFETYIVVR